MDHTKAHRREASQPPSASSPGPLRQRPIRVLLISEVISSLGSQMTFVTLPWFVLITTGSAARMSLVFAAEIAPVALVGTPSGKVIDRLGIRRTMLLADAVRAVLISAIPIMYYFGALSFWSLLLIVFCTGLFTAPYPAAQRLLIPEVLGKEESSVTQGNALVEGATRTAAFLGPALAGLLLTAIRPANVIWVDAATYALSFAILATWLPSPSPGQSAATDRARLLDGIKLVLRDPVLPRVSMAVFIFGLSFPFLIASLPIAAKVRYNGNSFTAGLLFAAWGIGGFIGCVAATRVARRFPPLRMAALAAVGLAAPTWLFWRHLSAWEFGSLLLISGVFTPVVNAPLITILLLRTSSQSRAQVLTFVVTMSVLAAPLGYVVAGPALEAWGLGPVLLVVAVGLTLAAVLIATALKADTSSATLTVGEALN